MSEINDPAARLREYLGKQRPNAAGLHQLRQRCNFSLGDLDYALAALAQRGELIELSTSAGLFYALASWGRIELGWHEPGSAVDAARRYYCGIDPGGQDATAVALVRQDNARIKPLSTPWNCEPSKPDLELTEKALEALREHRAKTWPLDLEAIVFSRADILGKHLSSGKRSMGAYLWELAEDFKGISGPQLLEALGVLYAQGRVVGEVRDDGGLFYRRPIQLRALAAELAAKDPPAQPGCFLEGYKLWMARVGAGKTSEISENSSAPALGGPLLPLSPDYKPTVEEVLNSQDRPFSAQELRSRSGLSEIQVEAQLARLHRLGRLRSEVDPATGKTGYALKSPQP